MEADFLVEGFNKSVELHNIKYTTFIGDGNSNVYSRLKEKDGRLLCVKQEGEQTGGRSRVNGLGEAKEGREDRGVGTNKTNKMLSLWTRRV
ncbi:hypothetical protein QE152_g27496 [Popillia japonica]|uniref:Mutator-like transposase domain-containing protein n=1 Tax=Popillia japonica TaxID=7064 RepID=A0AAW1JS14_POPJA